MAEKKSAKSTEKKTEAQLLADKLLYKPKNGGLKLSEQEIKKAEKYCEGYKKFLDNAKTEREAVTASIELAKKQGFTEYVYGKKYTAGDRIYYNNRGKAVIFAVIGSESIENGANITAAHIDSPRIDLKAHPLYEDGELAYFKTHYYGGIKKYQWVVTPLALHGVIVKKDGTSVDVCVGEDDNDPVFCITDLLPHLAREQMKRTLHEGIKGEELNVVIGSYPFRDDKASEAVKLNIIKLLNEKYGVVEADFMAAELELVPVYKARDIGFDRSLIGAYGQDDRVCAYPALTALFDAKSPKRTAVCVLTDKEEIGSVGNTGFKAYYIENFIGNIAKPYGIEARRVLSNSKCLSADVNAAFDPTFPSVSEKKNTCYLNYGVVVTKFTGSGGKSGTSDASAEFVGEVNRLLDKNKVLWQTGELGAVDAGGGGTVAQYMANQDVDTIDVGVPVLSMHAPFEITSKIDVYSTYQAFAAFCK